MGMSLPHFGRYGRVRRWGRQLNQVYKWLNYEAGLTNVRAYPDRMYLESTNYCNLGCIMCPTGLKTIKRPKGHMDFGLFTSIVDEMAGHVKSTTLHIWGESLMHPRIIDMIAYCHEKGLRSEISTNATLLSEAKAQAILDAGLDVIYLCLDGVNKETYEAIRRNATFERTRANILNFVALKQARRQKSPQVNIQIIKMKPTAPEVDTFVREWQQVPGIDRINVKPFDSWAEQIDQVSELRQEDVKLPKRYPCPNLWFHVHIYWDGSLVMCDRDFDGLYNLGNVKDGVMKAWNGALMQELRRRHVHNDYNGVSPCDTCSEWAWWKPTPFSSQGNRPIEAGAPLEVSSQ
jgi:radical SAM protein with 4Fe4S-binding SPASM domain